MSGNERLSDHQNHRIMTDPILHDWEFVGPGEVCWQNHFQCKYCKTFISYSKDRGSPSPGLQLYLSCKDVRVNLIESMLDE